MSEKHIKTIGRFAPTPSGRLHIGNIFAALMAYLSAKSKGGDFIVRIEDLDTPRCPRALADCMLYDLERFGFSFDGEVLYQSERTEIYEHYANVLKSKGLVYPCFCTRAELHAAHAPHLSDGSIVYDGRCARLTKEEAEERMKTRRALERVRVPDSRVEFDDMIVGRYSQNLVKECGDFVIRRSDGVFAYQLAVVVDDALSGVTEVVRGMDLISSAPRQIWLAKTLGFEPPSYAHVPLLCASGGRRLSKRDGDTAAYWLERFSPREIIGKLAYAAGLIEKEEPVSVQELVPFYNPRKIPKTIEIEI